MTKDLKGELRERAVWISGGRALQVETTARVPGRLGRAAPGTEAGPKWKRIRP